MQCPACQRPVRVVAIIDLPNVVKKILRHMNLEVRACLLCPGASTAPGQIRDIVSVPKDLCGFFDPEAQEICRQKS